MQLERLARHANRAERTLHRSLKELRQLQTARFVRQQSEKTGSAPPLADLTKRTQPKRTTAPWEDELAGC